MHQTTRAAHAVSGVRATAYNVKLRSPIRAAHASKRLPRNIATQIRV